MSDSRVTKRRSRSWPKPQHGIGQGCVRVNALGKHWCITLDRWGNRQVLAALNKHEGYEN